jgi:hypothetical protein
MHVVCMWVDAWQRVLTQTDLASFLKEFMKCEHKQGCVHARTLPSCKAFARKILNLS